MTSAKDLWRLGVKDGSCSEFGMTDKSYTSYTQVYPNAISVYDAFSDKSTAIPYFLPGPSDNWASNPNGSLLVKFGIKEDPAITSLKLIMDFVEVHPRIPTELEVNVNGIVVRKSAPAGRNQDYLDTKKTDAYGLSLEFDLPKEALKKGANAVFITALNGSWLVWDDIRMEVEGTASMVASPAAATLLSVSTEPALVYGPDKESMHPVRICAINSGRKPIKAEWFYDGVNGGFVTLAPGYNVVDVAIPEGYDNKTVQISMKTGKDSMQSRSLDIIPAEKWTVYFVQHTHTDIGYTKPQTEILAEHLRYIDYAVEYCDATSSYPDDAQFRWTCEAAWAVKEWLRIRPADQVQRFINHVRNGRIEVTAMFFNMSELSGENNYRTFFEPVAEFHDAGIEVVTAMQNDVNGLVWGLADYLPDIGVRYITMGSNNHRADIPFDRPTVYWWESPSGNRLMSYRIDHYHTGNFWGLHNGRVEAVHKNIYSYIRNLKSKGYPFPLVSVQYSGYHTDNSPPSVAVCDIVKEWNERYAWPKLRNATAQEFLREIEKGYSDKLPVWRAAYPDWWTDGFGSAARETTASRKTQSDMITVSGMLSMASLGGDKYVHEIHDNVRNIHENLLFYDEHTFGAAESISSPNTDNSQVQWAEKGSYVWEALKSTQMLYETAIGRLQGQLYRSQNPTMTVFNPSAWERSSLIELYIDYEVVPNGRPFCIVDENGNEMKIQPGRSRNEGRYWLIWVENVPAMGYRTYDIVLGKGSKHDTDNVRVEGLLMENDFYTIRFAPEGGICSIYDKELARELVDADSEWNFGAPIYESLNGDRRQMERKVFVNYRRSGMTDVRYTSCKEGEIFKSISYVGKLEGCDPDYGVRIEVRLYNNVKRIEMSYALIRKPETDPSGLYVAFPMSIQDGKLKFDVPGGVMEAGVDQIPRTSAAWNTVQNFVSAQNSDMQMIISTDAMPLFMMGELLNDPYRIRHVHEKTHAFSWITNNYWTTNFRASQEGELKWNYVITSKDGNLCSEATRFGWGNRVPLYARVMPGAREASAQPKSRSFLEVPADNLIVTSVVPSVNMVGSVNLNVRETDGKKTSLKIYSQEGKPMSFIPVNILDEPLGEMTTEIELLPYDNVFVRLVPNK